ncbi:MAG: NAD-dependent epimerase, partial [Pseudomonadota bacterium]
FVDGRAVRLPTIVIRPGVPNKAASSFASSILREPLQGLQAICPVSKDLAIWIKSPRGAVADLIHAHDLPGDGWPDGLRVLNLPGMTVTVAEMVAALERGGGDAGLISWEPDANIEAIVGSWPQGMRTDRADALGFSADENLDAVVQQFVEDELGRWAGRTSNDRE